MSFRHQTTGTKNNCIDRVYIKVIHRNIPDRMNKMTMNRPLYIQIRYHADTKPIIIITWVENNKVDGHNLLFISTIVHNR